jgi:hypothetical protein
MLCDFSKTVEDFYSLKPTDIKQTTTDEGVIYTGKLSDGKTINARSFSSGEKPTLQITDKTGILKQDIKIRYMGL